MSADDNIQLVESVYLLAVVLDPTTSKSDLDGALVELRNKRAVLATLLHAAYARKKSER